MSKTVEFTDEEYQKYLLFKEQEDLKSLQNSSEELKVLEAKNAKCGIKYDIDTKSYYVRLNYLGKRYAITNYTSKYKCKSLEATKDKIEELKKAIDKGENPLDTSTFDTYMDIYFKGLKKETAKIYKSVYIKYAQKIIGNKKPYKLSKKDIEEIYEDMVDSESVKSNNTIQKLRSILLPTYKTLYNDGKIAKNYLLMVKKPDLDTHKNLSPLNIRLKDQDFMEVARKLYIGINQIEHTGIRYYLLITLMTMRRRSEINMTSIHDINDNIVTANNEITKTSIDERYIIPTEIIEYLKTTDKIYPFKADVHAYNRAWKNILTEQKISFQQVFRVYDTRHLFR